MNNDRNNVVSDIDLNSPPADSQEGNLTLWEDVVSSTTSSAVDSQPLPNVRSFCAPIIVDSEEVETLPLPTGHTQLRNSSTRSPLMIVWDEAVEINPRQSGNVLEDPATTLTLFTRNKVESVPPNTTIVNCGHVQDTDADRSSKRRIVLRPTQEPAKVVSKEPDDNAPTKVVPKKSDEGPVNIPIEEPAKQPNSEPAKKSPIMICPICLSPLVEASSTICGHVFCRGCIKKALRVFKRCPTCRNPLSMKNVHPIFFS